jgi:hypothetical protein
MQIGTERKIILTLTEDEAALIASALESVNWPDDMKAEAMKDRKWILDVLYEDRRHGESMR